MILKKQRKLHKKAIKILKAIKHFENQKLMWEDVDKDFEGLFRTGSEIYHKIDICDRAINRLHKMYNKHLLKF